MTGNMTISPKQVASIADTLEKLNTQLSEKLDETKQQMKSLSNSWTGSAAEATISRFNSFAEKYFASYKQLIDNYIKFLRVDVVEGYTQVQKSNEQLADEI